MGKLTIDLNKEKNLLKLKFSGFFTDDEVAETLIDLQYAIDELEPGFIVVNDVRLFKPAGVRGLDHIRNVMKYAASKGVKKVIRIAKELSLGSGQFNKVGSELSDYRQYIVWTEEEAEALLAR